MKARCVVNVISTSWRNSVITFAHPGTGKPPWSASDCHSVHPNEDDRERVRTTKRNSITCHAEVAAVPFVFEHDPTSDLTGEGCLECHNPHGSPNPNILNAFSRGLCVKCHTDKSVANHHPGRNCSGLRLSFIHTRFPITIGCSLGGEDILVRIVLTIILLVTIANVGTAAAERPARS